MNTSEVIREFNDVKREYKLEALDPSCPFDWSPDGQAMVTASGSQASVWSIASGKKLTTLTGPRANIWSVAFSPDGKTIALGLIDETPDSETVWIYDA